MELNPRFSQIMFNEISDFGGPKGDAVFFVLPPAYMNKAAFVFDGQMVGLGLVDVTPTVVGMDVSLEIEWLNTIETFNGRNTDDWIADIEVQWSDSTPNSYIGASHVASHTYTTAGTYQILVTVYGNDGFGTAIQNAVNQVTVS